MNVTNEMVEAAWAVMSDRGALPYWVGPRNYIARPPWSREQVDALRAEDEEFDRMNREFVREVLIAALNARC